MASIDTDPPETSSTIIPTPFTYSTPPPELLAQGAEALLYRTHFLTPSHLAALKYRPAKPYRHPILDKRLTKHRILSEARTLVRCRREGVSVPGVLALDAEGEGSGRGGWMMMEWVEGRTVREVLVRRGGVRRREARDEGDAKGNGYGDGNGWEDGVRDLMSKIGRAVGKMHEVGVIHGDLTTSNMMLRPRRQAEVKNEAPGVTEDRRIRDEFEGDIVLIDFGLSGQSIQEEDRAVDLYVLERAFGSTHPEAEDGFQEVLKAYGETYKGAKLVLKRLEDVRLRGRKKSMIG